MRTGRGHECCSENTVIMLMFMLMLILVRRPRQAEAQAVHGRCRREIRTKHK